jgi:hypothetical protein
MFFRFEIIRNKIEQKRKHTQENKSEKKEKNTKTNRKKTTKQLKFFFAIFRFCQIWFKNEKTDKNRKQKRQKIEKRKNIEFFFATISEFLPNLTQFDHFSSSRKGPQQLWYTALPDLPGSSVAGYGTFSDWLVPLRIASVTRRGQGATCAAGMFINVHVIDMY